MEIDLVIVHCSASNHPDQCTLEAIRELHTSSPEKKFQWGKYKTNGKGFSDVGYHDLVLPDGRVVKGRDPKIPGAHCRGFNSRSRGVCLVGNDNFTDKQIDSLVAHLVSLKNKYELSALDVLGHYELDKNKTCPNIDMDKIRRKLI